MSLRSLTASVPVKIQEPNMHRTIVLGLLLAAAACGRDKRESQEVALGDTVSATLDSSSADSTLAPSATLLPANQAEPPAKAAPESGAPKPAAAKPPAQEPAPQPAPPPVTAEEAAAASAIVGKLGVSVYPAKGQSKDQTVRDELACSDWAKQQTGIDLMTVVANTDSAAAAERRLRIRRRAVRAPRVRLVGPWLAQL